VGNLGKDSEMRYTQAGKALCSFNVAVSETWTDRNSNEKREKTVWHKCTIWGELSEKLSPYLVKGKQVYISGTVEAHAYLDNAGQPAASLEVNVRDILLLGGKGEGNHADEPAPTDFSKSDIPF